ncbi:hypothetical protein EOPP23_01870 [Endozoicomonas sp. OPT23]|uniref:M48 family metallopeptidase n=1 Tax=Endozoicomonas sp. OPT23 TaxID=2072845 RepID=UPI00129B7EE2|nr:M48 family metallopeptidase [Endozoicomonas sp. OPT23]MRI31743.1 hypothetical protein [Endozoicomonas sp. OPT23]
MGAVEKTLEEYKVLFSGRLRQGVEPEQAKQSFAKVFKLSADRVDRIFSGQPVSLKKTGDKQVAEKFALRLEKLGLECLVVNGNTAEKAFENKALESKSLESKSRKPEKAAIKKLNPNQLSIQDIDRMFSGQIKPVNVSAGYSLMLLFGALIILLLPLLYLAMTGAVAALTGYHAIHNLDLLLDRQGMILAAVFSYGGPIVIGTILVFFLLKPLLAPAYSREVEIRLDPRKYRRFYRFVEQICQRVGSPMPAEILVDHQVNASASLKKGLFSKELTLTVGMPLIYGMSSRQLAGILAHEFGHFSQSWAMRAGFSMGYIINWLYRGAFVRDKWDYLLEKWSEESEWFGAMITLYIARAGVWLSRKILHGLMYVALFVRQGLGRQMEFDADRYEARMSGSQHFSQTTRRLVELSIAYHRADELNNRSWTEGKLVNNLPEMTEFQAAHLTDDDHKYITLGLENGKTGLMDTHPCDQARIASAEKEKAEGIFTSDLSARVLFQSPEKLAERVTTAFYANNGLVCDSRHLISRDQQLEMTGRSQQSFETLEAYWGRWFDASKVLPVVSLSDVEDEQAVVKKLEQCKLTFRRMSVDYDQLEDQLVKANDRMISALLGRAWFAAGFEVDMESYGFERTEPEAIARTLREKAGDFQALVKKQLPMNKLLGEQLRLGLMLYVHLHPEDKQLISGMISALKSLRSQQVILDKIWYSTQALGHIEKVFSEEPDANKDMYQRAMDSARENIPEWHNQFMAVADTISVCLYSGEQPNDLGHHINAYLKGAEGSADYYYSAWEGMTWWHRRVMLRLGELALSAERHYDVQPLQIKVAS